MRAAGDQLSSPRLPCRHSARSPAPLSPAHHHRASLCGIPQVGLRSGTPALDARWARGAVNTRAGCPLPKRRPARKRCGYPAQAGTEAHSGSGTRRGVPARAWAQGNPCSRALQVALPASAQGGGGLYGAAAPLDIREPTHGFVERPADRSREGICAVYVQGCRADRFGVRRPQAPYPTPRRAPGGDCRDPARA